MIAESQKRKVLVLATEGNTIYNMYIYIHIL